MTERRTDRKSNLEKLILCYLEDKRRSGLGGLLYDSVHKSGYFEDEYRETITHLEETGRIEIEFDDFGRIFYKLKNVDNEKTESD